MLGILLSIKRRKKGLVLEGEKEKLGKKELVNWSTIENINSLLRVC